MGEHIGERDGILGDGAPEDAGQTMFGMLCEMAIARRAGRTEESEAIGRRVCNALDGIDLSPVPDGMVSLPALCRPGDRFWCADPHHAPLRARRYEVVSVEIGTTETVYHCRETDGGRSLGLHLSPDEFRRMMFAERPDAEEALAPHREEQTRYEEYVRWRREKEQAPTEGRES